MKLKGLVLLILLLGIQLLPAQEAGQLRWTFELPEVALSGPALDYDGVIYFGADDSCLYAISPDGSLRWKFKGGGEMGCPSVDHEGTIYVNGSDRQIYAITPDGQLKWQVPGDTGLTPPAICPDGTIISFMAEGGYSSLPPYFEFCKDPRGLNPDDGTELWSHETERFYSAPPCVGPDQKIWCAKDNGTCLYHFSAESELKGVACVLGMFSSVAPSTDGLGSIYFSGYSMDFINVTPEGKVSWLYTSDDEPITQQAVLNTRHQVLNTKRFGGHLFALNPCGQLQWQTLSNYGEWGPLTIGSNDVIFAGMEQNTILALNPDGTKKWTFDTEAPVQSVLALSEQGVLYATVQGKLLALQTDATGLADSPWPKCYRNNQNQSGFPPQPGLPPVVVLATDTLYCQPGQTVTLDGQQSYDPEGTQLDYDWFLSHGCETNIHFSTNDNAVISATISEIGHYSMTLRVSDADGQMAQDTVLIQCGKYAWTYQTNGPISSSPALGYDGSIYFGSDDKYVYALNPDGSLQWRWPTGGPVSGTPGIAADSTIYVASTDQYLYSLNPDGTTNWRKNISGDMSEFFLTISSDSVIYYKVSIMPTNGWDLRMRAAPDVINYEGVGYKVIGVLYTIGIDEEGYSHSYAHSIDVYPQQHNPVPHPSNFLVVYKKYRGVMGGRPSRIIGLETGETTRFEYHLPGFHTQNDLLIGSPVIGLNDEILVPSVPGYLFALDSLGKELWRKHIPNGFSNAGPIAGKDGTIFVFNGPESISMYRIDDGSSTYHFTDHHFLYALRPDGTTKWMWRLPGAITSNPVLADDGTLYFGAPDGKFYALPTDCGGPLRGKWSCYRGNPQRQGNMQLEMRNLASVDPEVPDAPPPKPVDFQLYPNYPNPFSGNTQISFQLAEPDEISLVIYDVTGRVVRTLHLGELASGSQSRIWDGQNNAGKRLSSGVYFLKLTSSNGHTHNQKLMLLR